MRGLSDAELKELGTWDRKRLLNTWEGYSDRAYLIALQDASGVANKSNADRDVRGVIKTRDALKKEIERRLPTSNQLIVLLEGYSNAIAHHSAFTALALGIPSDEKNESQIGVVKNDYIFMRGQVDLLIGS
jgi:hypothetical protein